MTWQPIGLADLHTMLRDGLSECSSDEQEFFRLAGIAPDKWRLSPWGDRGGGFWAVAVYRGRVLWYNDIEDGFNVSRFEAQGEIPREEYWCNQDSLRWALQRLQGDVAP